jgi:prophage tail gpP-like protein
LYYDGELLITGNIPNNTFRVGATHKLAMISGYSLTGVLGDCETPPQLYPLQSDGMTLAEIAKKICDYFKLKMVIDSSVSAKMNTVFKTVTANETQNIATFLTELATQKNIVITHNEKGELLFTEVKITNDHAFSFDLTKNTYPGIEFEFSIDGQAMHHEITVIKEADIEGEGNAGQYTIKNPYVLHSVRRPKVITQTSGTDESTELAARRALSNELRNIKLDIKIHDWKEASSIAKKIIRPNRTIEIYAPELYIWRKTVFFIEEVNFTGNQEEIVAEIKCVLPEVYTNKIPVSIFKGINMHALTEE